MPLWRPLRRRVRRRRVVSLCRLLALFPGAAGELPAMRRLTTCPLYAADAAADSNGDCRCPVDRPLCYESGNPWCTRNDGLRDLHYFGMSCETCACVAEAGQIVGQESFVCRAEGVDPNQRPNAHRICVCPEERPICVTRVGVEEKQGCTVPGGTLPADGRQMSADCADCVCRAECPVGSQHPFADSFGDCACPSSTPICFEQGQKGCGSNSFGSRRAVSHFRASCQAGFCVCQEPTGDCEPASCHTSSDCRYDVCRDCEMCEGISRCPADVRVSSEFPNVAGNCLCEPGLFCFEGEETSPGCPTAPTGLRSPSSFLANCRVCQCRPPADTGDDDSPTCPEYARERTPNQWGNCVCPFDKPDCYEAGAQWCLRSDERRDMHYFSVGCTNCECRKSDAIVDSEQQRPCPGFAASPVSDIHRNCRCPSERSSCVFPGGQIVDGRTGPLCPTSHGWNSSLLFVHDCTECRCEEGEGEGSKFKRLGPEELISKPEGDYMLHYLFADVRVAGDALDSAQIQRTIIASAQEDWKAAVLAGVKASGSAGATIEKLEAVGVNEYRDAGLEDVVAFRVRLDFGIMWREERSNSLRRLRSAHHPRRLQSEPPLRLVSNLTARETMLLRNLPAVLAESAFKSVLDVRLRQRLKTGEQTDVDSSELGSNSSGSDTSWPRLETMRVVVGADVNVALSWTGPLQPLPPARSSITKEADVEAEESSVSWMLILMLSGGAVGACLLCCLCYRACKCIMKRGRAFMSSTPRRSPRTGDVSPRGGGAHSPRLGGGAHSPRGTPSTAVAVDVKDIQDKGDLAGHKSLSRDARAVLEEEYEERMNASKKKKGKGMWKRGKKGADSAKEKDSAREGHSPRGGASPRGGSPRGAPSEGSDSEDSPRGSPRDRGKEGKEPDDDGKKKKRRSWFNRKKGEGDASPDQQPKHGSKLVGWARKKNQAKKDGGNDKQ